MRQLEFVDNADNSSGPTLMKYKENAEAELSQAQPSKSCLNTGIWGG